MSTAELLGRSAAIQSGAEADSPGFERFAGVCGVAAGALAFLYALAFVVLRNELLSALFLMATGLLGTAVLAALYGRVRAVDSGFALWGTGLAIAGVLGATIHGGYDLANAIHPPNVSSNDLPHPVDPRGLLTFGATGLGLLVLANLVRRVEIFSSGLAYLGFAVGALLVVIYLARLIIVDPTNPVLFFPVLIAGFLASPIWYAWLGATLLSASATRQMSPSRAPERGR